MTNIFDLENLDDVPITIKERKVTLITKMLALFEQAGDQVVTYDMLRVAYYRTYNTDVSMKTLSARMVKVVHDGEIERVAVGKFKRVGK